MSALIYIHQTALWVYQELQINKLKMNRCLCSEFVVSDTDATFLKVALFLILITNVICRICAKFLLSHSIGSLLIIKWTAKYNVYGCHVVLHSTFLNIYNHKKCHLPIC